MHSTVFKPSVLTSQAFSVIDYLNLNSKLDFEMNLNMDEPAFPRCREVCACGHVESQRPISSRDAHDATQGTQLIPPAFLPAGGTGAADTQVCMHRGQGGDPCVLGGMRRMGT